MVAMTVARTDLPTDRPLTVDDLDLLPDDGRRYELDDGVLDRPFPCQFTLAALVAGPWRR
jgi:hypothetical protein